MCNIAHIKRMAGISFPHSFFLTFMVSEFTLFQSNSESSSPTHIHSYKGGTRFPYSSSRYAHLLLICWDHSTIHTVLTVLICRSSNDTNKSTLDYHFVYYYLSSLRDTKTFMEYRIKFTTRSPVQQAWLRVTDAIWNGVQSTSVKHFVENGCIGTLVHSTILKAFQFNKDDNTSHYYFVLVMLTRLINNSP